MEMPEKIISERLVLERPYPISFKLAEEIFAKIEASRSTLRLHLPWVDKTLRAEDQFINYFATYCLDSWENKSGFPYIIRQKETNELIGAIDLMAISEQHKSGELGYYLFDFAVGFGYMQEALKCRHPGAAGHHQPCGWLFPHLSLLLRFECRWLY